MTHQERRARLTELYAETRKLECECQHSVPEQQPDKRGKFWAAICEGCGKDFGWYCPSSPDRICHYYSHEGKVVDVYGDREMLVPEGYDPKHESYDWCIFCGHPEERK